LIGVGRIERYVLGRTLIALGGALAIIAAVVMLIDFVDISRTVGVRADVGFSELLLLTLLRSPSTILSLAPSGAANGRPIPAALHSGDNGAAAAQARMARRDNRA